MQKWHVVFDFENETIGYPKAAARLRV